MKIKGFVHYKPASYKGETEWHFWPCDMTPSGYINVMPLTVEFEPPENFDPRQKLVDALQARKTEVMAEFQKRITDIDAQISKYLALEAA